MHQLLIVAACLAQFGLDGPEPQRSGNILMLASLVGALFGVAYLVTRQREEAEQDSSQSNSEAELPEDAIRIGACGRALSTLCPGGKIDINGRRRDARSEGASIPAGSQVIVVGGATFDLIVRPLAPSYVPGTLRGFGQPVLSFEQRRAALVEREKQDERVRAEQVRQQRAQAPKYGAGVALAWGAALLGWQWTLALTSPLEALLAVTLVFVAGVAVSLLLYFHDDAALASLGMVAGTVLSAVFTVPAFGLLAGVLAALAIGAALMLLAFFLILFGAC